MVKLQLNKDFVSTNIADFICLNRENVDSRMFWNEENFLLDMDSKWELSFAYLENNKLIAYIFASEKENNIGHINLIMVANEYRCKNIGSKMIMDFFQDLIEKNFHESTLWVYSNLNHLILFYENLGYVRIKDKTNQDGEKLSMFVKKFN